MEQGDENRPADSKSPPPLPGGHHTGVAKGGGIIGSAENKKALLWILIPSGIIGGILLLVGVAFLAVWLGLLWPFLKELYRALSLGRDRVPDL